jgi:hypothetical protein
MIETGSLELEMAAREILYHIEMRTFADDQMTNLFQKAVTRLTDAVTVVSDLRKLRVG